MKDMKKLLALSLVGVMAVGMFVGCGSKDSSDADEGEEVAETTVEYDTIEAGKRYMGYYDANSDITLVPSYQFAGGDLSGILAAGNILSMNVKLNDDGTFELYAGFANANNPSEDDQYYLNAATTATGTYTIAEDGKSFTITADTAEVTFEAGSDYLDNEIYDVCSMGDDATGTWSSADNEDVLACVPDTTFYVVDGMIYTWAPAGTETGNPND